MRNLTTAPTTGPLQSPVRSLMLPHPMRPLMPPPRQRLLPSRPPLASHKWLLAVLFLLAGLLNSHRSSAQIVHEKPAQIKAANRRALREAKRTESPYKDSHLDVTPAHLRRGQSIQHLPEGSDKLQYKPNPHPADRLDQRHKKLKL